MDVPMKGAERADRQAQEADDFHRTMKGQLADRMTLRNDFDGSPMAPAGALAARTDKWREL